MTKKISLHDFQSYLAARLAGAAPPLLVEEVALLRDCVAVARARWDFRVATAVILPCEVRMIWLWPEGNEALSRAWSAILAGFARHSGAVWDNDVTARPITSESTPARYMAGISMNAARPQSVPIAVFV